MDADSEERRRDRISRREKRWSMNSQRLEQIVAELMRPIGDLRHSFDTDLSALLEEYLTEAGLHALEAEGSPGSPGAPAGAPNFPELALLLQQSANIYGRKVDFLYQHVLAVSESLQLSTTELSQSSSAEAEAEGEGEAAAAGGARRKRRASALGWARVELEACAAARREPLQRPPPTLPRLFAELEPRVMGPADVPLLDYAGEPVGLLQDFHVAWRLHGGLLVDELECGREETPTLRAIPLAELQAAIEACAPPSPPPACSTPLPPEDPPPASPPPEPVEHEPAVEPPPDTAEEAAPRRKRKLGLEIYEDDAGKRVRLLTCESAQMRLLVRQEREFSVPGAWVRRVVAARRARLLRARCSLAPPLTEFHGFDDLDKSLNADIGGFRGFERSSATELAVSVVLSRLAEAAAAAADSEDDGFFEGSSHSSEGETRLDAFDSPAPPPPPPPPPPTLNLEPSSEWVTWRAAVLARATAGEAKGLDVRRLGAAVLGALPGREGGPEETQFEAVLSAEAKDEADVSRLFLATLFLANAGNVEVIPGPPLALAGFALRVLSRDERRYCAAAAADPAFLAR